MLQMGRFSSYLRMNTQTYSQITMWKETHGTIGSMPRMTEKDSSSCSEEKINSSRNWKKCSSCQPTVPHLPFRIPITGPVMNMTCSVSGCFRMPTGVTWFRSILGSSWTGSTETRAMACLETMTMPRCQRGWCLPHWASIRCQAQKSTFWAVR